MKKHLPLILFVLLSIGFLAQGVNAQHRFITSAGWAAARAQANSYRIHGNNELNQGRTSTAFGAFNEVHRLASESFDWQTLYQLAQLYCQLGYHNMSSQTFGQATAVAYDMAVFDLRRNGSGGDCASGRAGLAAAAGSAANIRDDCPNLHTLSTIDFWAQKAQQNLQMLNANYGPNGCPPVGFIMTYQASGPQGYNNQLTGSMPLRPFGFDTSNTCDAWCPFRFVLGPPIQVSQVLEAKFDVWVKSCGQLENTDQFLLYGNSGQRHVVFTGFPGDIVQGWGPVNFPVPDAGLPCDDRDHVKKKWDCGQDIRNLLINSMRNGWPLHCCLQDDSAVWGGSITINYLP